MLLVYAVVPKIGVMQKTSHRSERIDEKCDKVITGKYSSCFRANLVTVIFITDQQCLSELNSVLRFVSFCGFYSTWIVVCRMLYFDDFMEGKLVFTKGF